jgi:hypothetical protein
MGGRFQAVAGTQSLAGVVKEAHSPDQNGQSLTPNTEVKNAWSYTSHPPLLCTSCLLRNELQNDREEPHLHTATPVYVLSA